MEDALQRMMSSSLSFCRELVKIFYIFYENQHMS